MESWVLGRDAVERRKGLIERWHEDRYLKDGTARGELVGDGAHVHAHQKSKAKLQRDVAGGVGGLACD